MLYRYYRFSVLLWKYMSFTRKWRLRFGFDKLVNVSLLYYRKLSVYMLTVRLFSPNLDEIDIKQLQIHIEAHQNINIHHSFYN